jgi:hypothetical protein
MKRNGSPRPTFETDENRLWFVAKLPIHKAFAEEAARKAEEPGTKLALSRHQVAVLQKCRTTAAGQAALKSRKTKS